MVRVNVDNPALVRFIPFLSVYAGLGGPGPMGVSPVSLLGVDNPEIPVRKVAQPRLNPLWLRSEGAER